MQSRDDIDGVKVGTDFVPGHTHGRLTGNHPLWRNSSAPHPHRDPRLFHRLPGQNGQFLRKYGLTACGRDDPLYSDSKRVFGVINGNIGGYGGHIQPPFNTESVIGVNTRSVFPNRQTAVMARSGEISEFWRRLTHARTSCTPPKSMAQADIAKDYGVAGQSTVTKWKTGKGMPQYEVIKAIALNTNVNINWLWAGQGDMRPLPVTDPITHRIVEVLNTSDQAARIKVLELALLQRASTPQVAQILREAQAEAKEATADSNAARTRRRIR